MACMRSLRRNALRAGAAAAAVGAAAASYMVFEAQWPRCRQTELAVPGLPAPWRGLTILHLSDVHAGHFPTNDRSLEKVVEWAAPLQPDLVVLTGDIIGDPRLSARCLEPLGRLQPPLGMFAVPGNHEYGLGKSPLAKARDVSGLWSQAGATLLSDRCVALPPRGGVPLVLCGADYLTGGFGLLDSSPGDGFSVLLIHQPPPADSPLAELFPLAFAGHTHGGQLRLPSTGGLLPVMNDEGEYLSGVYAWGQGRLVVSRGVGTSFVPFRLLTRPEATLWRLV
jgi:predicted MPP superfamily phosphohydrolase